MIAAYTRYKSEGTTGPIAVYNSGTASTADDDDIITITDVPAGNEPDDVSDCVIDWRSAALRSRMKMKARGAQHARIITHLRRERIPYWSIFSGIRRQAIHRKGRRSQSGVLQ